jgi:hypothetical protein
MKATVIRRWKTNADSAESKKQMQFGAKVRIGGNSSNAIAIFSNLIYVIDILVTYGTYQCHWQWHIWDCNFFSGIWGIIPKNFFQNRTNGTIWSKLRYDSWSFQIRAGFQSGNIFSSALPFRTKSVLNKRSSLNSTLTSNGTDLGEEDYTKIVDNFDSFLESINTPLSDEWFRSNGFWKLSGAAGNSNFWTEWTDLTNSKFRSSFKWQPRELQIAKW